MYEEREDEFDCPMYVRHGRKYGHPLGIGAPHIPNKYQRSVDSMKKIANNE